MKLDEIVSWYQKKIGTYDKQQWEKTVEQKILNGFTSITLKNAKLKTEYIDVDLVRGSSFPKAKPKQSLLTVIRLAILRYFLLPLYAKWWVSQTSPKHFVALLCLYITQLINWAVYSFNIHKIENDSEHIVSLSELLIPMALSLILSLIHSQIVATNTVKTTNSKRKQIYNINGKTRERVRRRRKVTRLRSHEPPNNKSSSHNEVIETIQCNKFNSNIKISLRSDSTISEDKEIANSNFNKNINLIEDLIKPSIINQNENTYNEDDDVFCTQKPVIKNYLNELNLSNDGTLKVPNNDSASILRKRSVNWDSPIHNYASCEVNIETTHAETNTKLSTSSSKNKSVIIDDSVQEFYDNLIQLTDESFNVKQSNEQDQQNDVQIPIVEIRNITEQTGEDDGFESLNGKSSSGEENHNFDAPDNNLSSNKEELDLKIDNEKSEIQAHLRVSYKKKERKPINDGDLSEDETTTIKDDPLLIHRRNSASTLHGFRRKFPLSSESDFEKNIKISQKSFEMNRNSTSTISHIDSLHKKCSNRSNESSDTDEEGDDNLSSPNSVSNPNYTECTTSATDWFGITTNSEECSYSSEIDQSDFQNSLSDDGMYHDYTPTVILNPSCGSSDRINCTIWDHHEVKKAEMSVLDISSCIIERVEAIPETCDYIYIGVVFSVLLSLIPSFCRLCEATIDVENSTEVNYLEMPMLLWEKASFSFITILRFAFGETGWERSVLVIGFIQRLYLTSLLFFLFAVAERTFKQRFLYAKLFSHLTSSRRARKSDLPHFRLNKVRNIKTWLSVRSYLKRRGPQRSVEVIVSSAFMITLLLLAFLSVEWLKDSVHLHSQYNLEALLWSTALGIYLLRFMTLGNKINRKYRSISVLITEQINLYLQIEQKPKKKDELMVSNSVLKLAADLLKELESPFKISGLSANPYLYTTIKVVILSALSGVLSEMLGFKLKLHKIKIK